VEAVTNGEARYQFYVEYPKLKNKTREDSIEYFACTIRYNPELFSATLKKAQLKKVPIEEMLYHDALDKYMELRDIKR